MPGQSHIAVGAKVAAVEKLVVRDFFAGRPGESQRLFHDGEVLLERTEDVSANTPLGRTRLVGEMLGLPRHVRRQVGAATRSKREGHCGQRYRARRWHIGPPHPTAAGRAKVRQVLRLHCCAVSHTANVSVPALTVAGLQRRRFVSLGVLDLLPLIQSGDDPDPRSPSGERSTACYFWGHRARRPRSASYQVFATDAAFERWLSAHHDVEPEVWIKVHKISSGLASLTPAQALDVALCWGSITASGRDSTSGHSCSGTCPAGREAPGARSIGFTSRVYGRPAG